MDSITSEIPSVVNISLYADDVAVWAVHQDKATAAARVQTAVDIIADWSERKKTGPQPR